LRVKNTLSVVRQKGAITQVQAMLAKGLLKAPQWLQLKMLIISYGELDAEMASLRQTTRLGR
jgi:hypothetical protein